MRIRKQSNPETAPLWRSVPEEQRQRLYRNVEYMALRGFHADTIARVTGCTVNNVYTACAKLQIRLRDYRDGKTDPAKTIIRVVKGVRVYRRLA